MSAVGYDVTYQEQRNRLTTAFRFILAIPHLIVSQVWGYLAQIVGVIQWFIIVFTGKRNQGLWNLQQSWLGYYSRVVGYLSLLYDPYPAFGTDPGNAPVRTEISYEESANRLTNVLRFLWIIPALIVAIFVGIASAVVTLISWFAILFTGKQPKGMWDFVLKAVRYTLQLQSYALLMTDDYPKFGEGALTTSTSTSTPPPPPSSYVVPPPPPPAN
ncbi:MAG: hypothetical protein QOJ66_2745 [Ilumatobacteraceae bacterium]